MLDLIQGALFWIGKIPQDGLLGFLFRLILALIVYAIGTKVIAWLCRIVRKHLLKYGTDEAAKSFVMSILKISLHILLIICFHKIAAGILMNCRCNNTQPLNATRVLLYCNLPHFLSSSNYSMTNRTMKIT